MYVIQVIPLIKGIQLESLSYFSTIPYETGHFLQIPVRGKNQLGMAIDCKPVSSTKTALKAATFSLRKLPTQVKISKVPSALIETAIKLSQQYPATVGSILYNLLPPDIKQGERTYSNFDDSKQGEDSTPQVLMSRVDERFRSYQTHIRSTFAHRGSVLLVVPTTADIEYAVKNLSHGIEDRLVVLASNQTKKKQQDALLLLEDTTTAKLIITTPAFAYLPRHDLLSIIIEQSASPHYVMRTRPYLDHKEALMVFAKATGTSIVLGDTLVKTEDEAKRRADQYLTFGDEVKRLVFPAPVTIISQTDKPSSDTPFQLFSPQLIKTVSRTLEGKGHVFLYAARRGLAPVVACVDCGYIFRCPDSNTPYSLVRIEKNGVSNRWFVSSTSGKRVPAADVCAACGSWRLRERGIGIQQVYDEWKLKSPTVEATLIDHTIAPTGVKAKKIIDDFFSKKSGVLIGTQIAIPYLHPGVDVSAIISLDAARATPTWRSDESLFRLLLKLRECTKKELLVQTRTEPDDLLLYATRGATERFFDDEISLRQQLKYPPFNNFILLTWTGSEEATKQSENIIRDIVDSPLAQYYLNPHSTTNQSHRHALIRIDAKDNSTYEALITRLCRLPPYVKIEVNPERIV